MELHHVSSWNSPAASLPMLCTDAWRRNITSTTVTLCAEMSCCRAVVTWRGRWHHCLMKTLRWVWFFWVALETTDINISIASPTSTDTLVPQCDDWNKNVFKFMPLKVKVQCSAAVQVLLEVFFCRCTWHMSLSFYLSMAWQVQHSPMHAVKIVLKCCDVRRHVVECFLNQKTVCSWPSL